MKRYTIKAMRGGWACVDTFNDDRVMACGPYYSDCTAACKRLNAESEADLLD